jgi:hypothetical protein
VEVVAQFPKISTTAQEEVAKVVNDIVAHQDRMDSIVVCYFDTAGGVRVGFSGNMRLNYLCRAVAELQSELHQMLIKNGEYVNAG